MKVLIVGKKISDTWTNRETGEVVPGGVRFYYYAPKDEVEGYCNAELFIREDRKLYLEARHIDCSIPFFADLDYDQQPGRKGPVSVLTEIRPLGKDEAKHLTEKPDWQNFIPLQMLAK